MHLKWTRPAINDLKDVGEFIALDRPQAAERMAERVKEAIEYLMEPSFCKKQDLTLCAPHKWLNFL